MCFDVIYKSVCLWTRLITLCLFKCSARPNESPHSRSQSCGSSSFLIDQMTYDILSKWGSSLHCGRVCSFSECQPHQMICYIWHIFMLFLLLWVTVRLLRSPAWWNGLWHSEHLCILPPQLASAYLYILILFAQIRKIQHHGVWQTTKLFTLETFLNFLKDISFKDF